MLGKGRGRSEGRREDGSCILALYLKQAQDIKDNLEY